MSDSTVLLPCPFCGGQAWTNGDGVSEYHGRSHQDIYVECRVCGARTKDFDDINPDVKGCADEAIAAWNTRSQGEAVAYRMTLEEQGLSDQSRATIEGLVFLAEIPRGSYLYTAPQVAVTDDYTLADAIYDNLAAADNGDIPLEEYPQRIFEVISALGYSLIKHDDVAARELYEKYSSNHPTIHCNRFLAWSDLSDKEKSKYRLTAALAKQGEGDVKD